MENQVRFLIEKRMDCDGNGHSFISHVVCDSLEDVEWEISEYWKYHFNYKNALFEVFELGSKVDVSKAIDKVCNEFREKLKQEQIRLEMEAQERELKEFERLKKKFKK